MPLVSANHGNGQMREYCRADSAVFLKTKEKFGGLSNMAGGFPLVVNSIPIRTSEALYQACRFPHMPNVQRSIIEQRSPMTAKMKSKPHRQDSRSDWDDVRVKIMRWCLQVKLAQNWDTFSELLLSTEDRQIVEHSRRDDFWGAKPVSKNTLVGMNTLGRLLMGLREEIKNEPCESFLRVKPLHIPDFHLYGCEVAEINELSDYQSASGSGPISMSAPGEVAESPVNPAGQGAHRIQEMASVNTDKQLPLPMP